MSGELVQEVSRLAVSLDGLLKEVKEEN